MYIFATDVITLDVARLFCFVLEFCMDEWNPSMDDAINCMSMTILDSWSWSWWAGWTKILVRFVELWINQWMDYILHC